MNVDRTRHLNRGGDRRCLRSSPGFVILTERSSVPPPPAVQHGFRGTGMDHHLPPGRAGGGETDNNVLPDAVDPVDKAGIQSEDSLYKNVKVLGDVDVGGVPEADGHR